jgi:hypothetical protein
MENNPKIEQSVFVKFANRDYTLKNYKALYPFANNIILSIAPYKVFITRIKSSSILFDNFKIYE